MGNVSLCYRLVEIVDGQQGQNTELAMSENGEGDRASSSMPVRQNNNPQDIPAVVRRSFFLTLFSSP